VESYSVVQCIRCLVLQPICSKELLDSRPAFGHEFRRAFKTSGGLSIQLTAINQEQQQAGGNDDQHQGADEHVGQQQAGSQRAKH